MIFQLIEIRHLTYNLLEFFFQLRDVLLGQREVFAGASLIRSDLLRRSSWVLEISSHCNLDLLAAIHQPQHDEESHHSGDEVRVCNLPRATMMSTMPNDLFYDDGLLAFLRHSLGSGSGSASGTTSPTLFFYFLKAGPDVAWNRSTSHFDSHNRRATLHECGHQNA